MDTPDPLLGCWGILGIDERFATERAARVARRSLRTGNRGRTEVLHWKGDEQATSPECDTEHKDKAPH